MHEAANEGDLEPTWLSRGRIPGLDALRAISISFVLIAHARFAASGGSAGNSFGVLSLGFLGVDTFFGISGFLITLLLLREQSRFGRISLRDFYRRRAFRILPAYFAYLLVIFAATRIGWATAGRGDWIAALTYTMNWRNSPTWVLGHLWSLSVEEQFYLLWPPLFLVLSSRSACRMLVGCIVAEPLYRFGMRAVFPNHEAWGRTGFPAQLAPIAAGCLLALLASDAAGRKFLKRWCGESWQLASAVLLLGACTYLATRSGNAFKIFSLCGRQTVSALLIAMVIWGCATTRNSLLRGVLAFKPIVGLGVLSYSIYLWQQPFLDGTNPSRLCRFPLNIGIPLFVALCSYFLIERPMLKIKDRKRTEVSADRNSHVFSTGEPVSAVAE